jgi:hypothetical protein
MGRLTEGSMINIKNKSHSATAEVDVPETGAEGVIVAQGGASAGWSLHAKGGKPRPRLRRSRGQNGDPVSLPVGEEDVDFSQQHAPSLTVYSQRRAGNPLKVVRVKARRW